MSIAPGIREIDPRGVAPQGVAREGERGDHTTFVRADQRAHEGRIDQNASSQGEALVANVERVRPREREETCVGPACVQENGPGSREHRLQPLRPPVEIVAETARAQNRARGIEQHEVLQPDLSHHRRRVVQNGGAVRMTEQPGTEVRLRIELLRK